MKAKESLAKLTKDFLKYYDRNEREFRHDWYTIHEWNEKMANKRIRATYPRVYEWFGDGIYEKISNVDINSNFVENKEFPLIRSRNAFEIYFNYYIQEIFIESTRKGGSDKTDLIDKYCEEFIKKISRDKAIFTSLTVLQGLGFEETPIDISEKSTIEEITDREREVLMNSNLMVGGNSLQRYLNIQENVFAIKSSFEVNIEDLKPKQRPRFAVGTMALREEKENISQSLRLLGYGKFTDRISIMLNKTFWNMTSTTSSSMDSPIGRWGQQQEVPQERFNKLIEIYELISEVKEDEVDEGFRVGLERFKSSYSKTNNTDALVDCVIGIEALISTGRSDNWGDIKRRTAFILDDFDLYDSLDKFWDERNTAVHGQEANVSNDEQDEVRDVLRRLLLSNVETRLTQDLNSAEQAQKVDSEIKEAIKDIEE